MDSIESVGGREMSDGNRYRADWTGRGYDLYRDEGNYWFGIGNVPAGRPWSERMLTAEIERRLRCD